jgi:phosphoribosylamine--glycine ligase
LKTDLLEIMMACSNETLANVNVEFDEGAACCVILASNGYPQKYENGFEISVDDDCEAQVYVAGAKCADGKLLTAGGRVLGVTSVGKDLSEAVSNAYKNVEKVHFENAYYRHDIGAKALKVLNEKV